MARNLEIKLSVKDADVFRRALAGLGKDGEAALKKFEASMRPATAGMKVMDATAAQARQGLESFAAQAGPLGGVLSSVGVKGLAAAAGIGAIVVGMQKLAARAMEAIRAMDDLDDSAKKLGVGTDFLQEIRFAAQQMGSDVEETNGALEKLSIKLGDIARGDGAEAMAAFNRIGFNAFDANGKIKTLEAALPELADRLSHVADQQERLSIASDLFGKGNAGFVRALQDGRKALEDNIRMAREMGAVVDENLVKKGADAQDKIAALSQVIDAELNAALVELAPIMVSIMGDVASLAATLRSAFDAAGTLVSKMKELGLVHVDWRALTGPVGLISELGPDAAALGMKAGAYLRGQIGGAQGIGSGSHIGGMSFAPPIPAQPQTTADGKGGMLKTKEERDQDRKAAEEAIKRLEEHRKAIEAQVQSLIFQREQTSRTAREQFIYNAVQEAGADATNKEKDRIREAAAALYDKRKAVEDQTKAEEANKEAIKQVTQAELDRQAAMNQRRASVGVENSLTQFMDDATNFAAMSEQVTTDFLGGMEDAWARFAATGKVSFKELASSMIDDLSRISFKLAMSGILDWLKGGVSSGGGGFLSTVASTLFGGGAAGHPLYGASGMVFDGGVIASPRSFRRGGRRAEAGENGPEGVLPLERTSDGRLGVLVAGGGGMGNVTVAPSFPINVHYHGNSQPEIGAAPDGRGGLDLIFKNIARSEASDVIEQTMPDYGAKKLRVRR